MKAFWMLILPVIASVASGETLSTPSWPDAQSTRHSETGDGYELLLEFPSSVLEVSELNDSLHSLASGELSEFISSLEYMYETDPTWRFHISFSHEPSPAGYVCVLACIYQYIGGAHGIENYMSFLYDLQTDEFVDPLDLVGDSTAFLSLAQAVCDTLFSELGSEDPEWIMRGASPTRGNYRIMLPVPDENGALGGFHVVFPAYQVAPYNRGIRHVMVPRPQPAEDL